MELKAKFKSQQEVVERNNFKSRKVWVITEDNPQYPQMIEIEVQQLKVDMFSGVTEGAPVTCHCNLRGREWTNAESKTSVFNTIVCWKVEGAPAASVPGNAMESKAPPIEDTGGLPF